MIPCGKKLNFAPIIKTMESKKKVLLVVATPIESELIKKFIEKRKSVDIEFDLCITGIGMINTAFRLGEAFAKKKYDLAINLGIAGAYDGNLEIGDVVQIKEEIIAELGVKTINGFEKLEFIGFPNFKKDGLSYYNSITSPYFWKFSIPIVRSLSVNTITGTDGMAMQRQDFWKAEIENMEGAAFFQSCILSETPFVAFRGISNYVEQRDASKWEIQKASENVQKFVIEWIKNFKNEFNLV